MIGETVKPRSADPTEEATTGRSRKRSKPSPARDAAHGHAPASRRASVVATPSLPKPSTAGASMVEPAPGDRPFELQHLATVLDAVADGITVQGADGRLVYANAQGAAACGYDSPAALLAAPVAEVLARFELVDEDLAALPREQLPGSAILRGEPPSSRVVGFRHLETGELRWANVSARPVHDKAGELRYAVNAFNYITTSKEMEAILRRREIDARALRRQAEVAAARADRLQRLAIELTRVASVEAAVRLVLQRGIRSLGAHGAEALLVGDDGRSLVAAPGTPQGASTTLRGVGPLDAAAPVAAAVRDREPTWHGSLEALEAAWPKTARQARAAGIQAIAVVPLVVEGHAAGALVVEFAEPQAFDAGQRDTIRAIVDMLAIAIHRIRLAEARERLLAERDAERARLASLLAERLADEARLAELVHAEHERAAELNAVVGAIGDPLVVVGADGTIPLANRAAEPFVTAGSERTLASLLRRFVDPPPADVRELVARSPLQLRTPDPDPRWYEVAAYPVEPGAETILILHDVTEVRIRESIRDSFIGVLSHELRTPVTTIFAGAKVLARPDSRLDEAARASIFEDIHAEAERLHRLVEDVVALTRFGEGALEIGTDPVLLQRVVPAVIRSEEGRWPGGDFEVDLAPDLPPVAGDLTYVEQVLRNLLANAMKYGGPKPVARIEATATGRDVTVRVLDRGPGFPADEASRLFELYYRSPSVARLVSGSGIGLFVCARLIEAMGGQIWAANRTGGGAEFGFTLRIVGDEG